MAEPLAAAPPAEHAESDTAALRAELAALRQRFRMLDDVDLKTSELVGRLAETMRTLVELRARTSLDISATLERIEARIDAQEARQREVLRGLREEIAAVQRSAGGLAHLAATIEAGHRALLTRVAQQRDPEQETPATAEPAAAPTPLFPAASGGPRQAVSVARPTASTIVLRFEHVESPATALSLQRFVSRIPGVVAVTGRQFVGRTLKLDVNIRGDLLYDDLLDWPGGELALDQTAADGAVLIVTRLRAL